MTLIDSTKIDWTAASDADVHWAAEGGQPQAVAEKRHREAMARVLPVAAANAARIKARKGH